MQRAGQIFCHRDYAGYILIGGFAWSAGEKKIALLNIILNPPWILERLVGAIPVLVDERRASNSAPVLLLRTLSLFYG